MPTVAIMYGLAEGPRTASKLHASLQAKGFSITEDASEADIIIAHSGGSYLIPENSKAKAVLLAGPSCGYRGRSQIFNQMRKVHHDLRHARDNQMVGQWWRKSGQNFVYLTSQPRRLLRMWRNAKQFSTNLPVYTGKRVAVITYKNDPWSGYLPAREIERNDSYCFISHDGVHDDLWINPETYMTVIQYLHES